MVCGNRLWAYPLGALLCMATVFGQGTNRAAILDPDVPSPLGLGESTGFGHALAWVGEQLVIGAPRSHRSGERGGALWAWSPMAQETTPIFVPGNRDWSSLGWSLNAARVDHKLAAGAPGEEVQGVSSGAVHLLQTRPTGIHWLQRLQPQTPEANAGFGHALAWDGGDLWVAAPFASGPVGFQAGYLARFAQAGTGFGFADRRVSPSPQAGARFGEALVIADQEIIVGAPGQLGGGVVFVMPLQAGGASSVQGLSPTVPLPAHGGFGSSLAVSEDRSALAVGIPWLGAGAVQLFQRDGAGLWQPRRLVRAPHGNGASAFGSQLTFDGSNLWISAPGGGGQVFCMADWRSQLAPLLFASGGGEVALGRAILPTQKPFLIGAPGHGRATFEPAEKASVRWQCRPRLQHFDLGEGVSAQSVVHGAPWQGLLALGAGGLPANKRVELRISDPSVPTGWRVLGAGPADGAGAWQWSGDLSGSSSGHWRLELHIGNAFRRRLRIQAPSCE